VPAVLDLASLAAVRAFAGEYLARGAPLDVLVCNAVSGGGVLKHDSVRRISFAEPMRRHDSLAQHRGMAGNAKAITTL
jgi:NAD(P)-dependent dehydrogenase (short-subunit alcohol dehydrogenase family)